MLDICRNCGKYGDSHKCIRIRSGVPSRCDKDGAALQSDVQSAVNSAKESGATQVIVLGHLGIDTSSQPWTSKETIANVTEIDAAIMNGGGVRNTAIEGDISYKTCKDIHTFGNVACLQTVTGQQLLDALEWGTRQLGTGENGGFPQVAGMTYKIDTSTPNTVKEDEPGMWIGGPDKYRVCDVEVFNKESGEYEALDTEAEYNLAGYNYTLRNLGDGYAMFDGAVNILDYVAEDYMVLANYVESFENGIVKAQNSPLKEKYPTMLLNYQSVNGSGRIENKKAEKNVFDDVNVSDWFYEHISYVIDNSLMDGVTETEFAPNENITREQIAAIMYRYAEMKGVAPTGAWAIRLDYAAEGIMYCTLKGIMDGKDNNMFAPKENVTRVEIAAVLQRFAEANN